MANTIDSTLTTSANVIKNETTNNANTATRVGTMLNDIIDSKINNDKISTNTALGTSDTLVPSQKAVKTYADALKPYTVFVGELSQTGTGNPTITVLENTTGYTFTCTRAGAGDYDFAPTSGTPFTANKTWVSIGQSAPNVGDIFTTSYTYDTTSSISIITQSLSMGLSDEILGHTSIEIRIYP